MNSLDAHKFYHLYNNLQLIAIELDPTNIRQCCSLNFNLIIIKNSDNLKHIIEKCFNVNGSIMYQIETNDLNNTKSITAELSKNIQKRIFKIIQI